MNRYTYPAGLRSCVGQYYYFLDTKLLVTMPGMSHMQLFPVSSLLIGSTLLLDCTHAIGEKRSLGPRGTRLSLFIQIAGKHSVFRKIRQLLLHLCPLVLQYSPSFFVFLTSEFLLGILSLWETRFRHLASLREWEHTSLSKINLSPLRRCDALSFSRVVIHFIAKLTVLVCGDNSSPRLLHDCLNRHLCWEHL